MSKQGEFVEKGRTFIHDASNHICVAHAMSNIVLAALRKNPSGIEKQIGQLEESVKALDKLVALLKEHREYLRKL